MAKKNLAMIAPAAVALGTPVDVSDMTGVVVEVFNIGVGTYKVMVSYNGTAFVQAGSSLTADGKQAIDDAAQAVRVDCSAFTSGTPAAVAAGVRSPATF